MFGRIDLGPCGQNGSKPGDDAPHKRVVNLTPGPAPGVIAKRVRLALGQQDRGTLRLAFRQKAEVGRISDVIVVGVGNDPRGGSGVNPLGDRAGIAKVQKQDRNVYCRKAVLGHRADDTGIDDNRRPDARIAQVLASRRQIQRVQIDPEAREEGAIGHSMISVVAEGLQAVRIDPRPGDGHCRIAARRKPQNRDTVRVDHGIGTGVRLNLVQNGGQVLRPFPDPNRGLGRCISRRCAGMVWQDNHEASAREFAGNPAELTRIAARSVGDEDERETSIPGGRTTTGQCSVEDAVAPHR